jgi:hypothetical protein
MRLCCLLLVLVGCHPYLAVGYDARTTRRGPLADAMVQPIARSSAAPAAATAPADEPKSFSGALGGGTRNVVVAGTVLLHEISSGSWANPDAGTPHYVTATASVDVAWTWLRWKLLSTALHGGPARTALVDRTSGEVSWANGIRYGASAAVSLAVLTLYVDLHKELLQFADGPATGRSSLTGVTLGVAFH